MSPDRLNPAERSAAESDYQKKFNPKQSDSAKKLKQQEASGGDSSWKTSTQGKKSEKKQEPKKGRFKFLGGRSGKLRRGSAFGFIIFLILGGVWYTSVFAPNILLVNIKEMYTNDLADATVALDVYTKKMFAMKIGMSQCGDKQSIKCKLSTMSRGQKKAFEKQGFTVLANKVEEDNLDDDDSKNDKAESRYQVTAILPPLYTSIINDMKLRGLSLGSNFLSGRLDQLGNKVSSEASSFIKEQVDKVTHDPLDLTPIVTGDMLYLYAQLNDRNKARVYGVFNPKTSYYQDLRFKQRIKQKYGLTKDLTTGGSSEAQVNKSFDNSIRNSSGGIDPLTGRPDPTSGVSLGSLSSPVTVANMIAAGNVLAVNSYSYTDLECSWYTIGKATSNAAKQAKSATIARFAMQYLKAADAIKAGTAEEMPTNVLSSKLAQATFGGYGGTNATDSSMYKSIVYGELPIPSIYGLLYYLDSFETIAALAPAWAMVMASATGLAGVTGAPGTLSMPPANLAGTDRDYCLSGETIQNKTEIKGTSTDNTRCKEAILAMAPPGMQGLVADAAEVGRRTCPPVNPQDDNFLRAMLGDWRGPISNVMLPSVKIVQAQLTSVIAGLFGGNLVAWANAESLLFSSNTKGVAASDALFAGTGELLGDMAQSRGMTPGNLVTMPLYLAQKEQVEKDYEDVARYNARQNQFDIYNKYSFLGSITSSLSPVAVEKAPLFSTIANVFSTVGSGLKQLSPTAQAWYYTQPIIYPLDIKDPASIAKHAAGMAQYMLRFTCPDPEYLAIGITADTACNVRYQMGKIELTLPIMNVLDYMTKAHPDLTEDNIKELEERAAKADPLEGSQVNVRRMLEATKQASNKPQIDEKTGEAIPGSEYEKFLDYCVNRQDPWGRSGIALHRGKLSKEEREKRTKDKNVNLDAISPRDSGDPYQPTLGTPYVSIQEGAKADQDWYTGKKCLEESEELQNFRAYTMACSVDGSMSGGTDCTDLDNNYRAGYANNGFFLNNDILYTGY